MKLYLGLLETSLPDQSRIFVEPGGNYGEIESYENRHKAGLPEHIAYPWKTKLTEEKLPGCRYIPQAMTHGTMECTNLEASIKRGRVAVGAWRCPSRIEPTAYRHTGESRYPG